MLYVDLRIDTYRCGMLPCNIDVRVTHLPTGEKVEGSAGIGESEKACTFRLIQDLCKIVNKREQCQ